MGTKQIVVDPNPPYMGCALQITKNSKEQLKLKLVDYENGHWQAEEKLDGQWAYIEISNGKVQKVISRGGCAKNNVELLAYKFPYGLSGILTGETGYGSSNPNMQNKTYVVYDFVRLQIGSEVYDGRGIQRGGRRHILDNLDCWSDKVHPVEMREKGFFEFYEEVLAREGEGLVLKYLHGTESIYRPGTRSEYQIKVKKDVQVDMVVMRLEMRNPEEMSALTKSKGMENWIKNIICGQYQNGVLVEETAVGSMEESTRKWFTEHQQEAIGKVVVIQGNGQFTKTGAIRHPFLHYEADGSFLRDDIRPEDCQLGKVKLI